MRAAMADAEVGDDGYGEDPTVNRLEETFAARVAKEAAVFVPSGTMGNQIALRCLGRPGTSVVVGARQHVVAYENGAAGMNSGTQFHLVDDGDGTIDPAALRWAIEAADHHHPPVSVVCVENTHMPDAVAAGAARRDRSMRRAGPSRRRPAVQRCGGHGETGGVAGRTCHHRHVLPVERPGRSRRLTARRTS